MEGDNNVEMGGGSGGAPASSRWNPTKEQISVLENLYGQGIRTPSAEQIQQITGRLRAYGHIEGKNVFYWFQNHKARQRQRQKQESLASISRFLHHHTTQPPAAMLPPPCPNVVCSPYYNLPQSDPHSGFYPQYHSPKVLLPGGFKRKPSSDEKIEMVKFCNGNAAAAGIFDPVQHGYNNLMMKASDSNGKMFNNEKETLALFPLHPTGILRGTTTTKSTTMASLGSSFSSTPSPNTSSETNMEDGSNDTSNCKPFFDFFPGQDSCESD